MKKISIILCNDMHMDLERANNLICGILENNQNDYQITTDYTEADIVIIDTCAFGNGKKNSIYIIADVQNNIKQNAQIIVTGCLVNINKQELEAIPGILVKSFKEVEKMFFNEPPLKKRLIPQNRVIISEGCKKKCSYCVYPLLGIPYKSKPIEDILSEIEEMYQDELTIYISGALESSDYGIDLYGTQKIAELMDTICTKYPHCNYVLGWFHPSGLTDEMISVLSKHKNIIEIMVHIQHVSNKILKQMNRPSFEFTNSRLQKLKKSRPDIIISSEVIVGFPGETNQDFQDLISYLDSGLFQDIGIAAYEPVLNTKAALLPNSIEMQIRINRMQFLVNRYNSCAYPAPQDEFTSIIETYIQAKQELSIIPKNILNNSFTKKYPFIAVTDTELKFHDAFSQLLAQSFKEIINSRNSYDILKTKNNFSEKYTLSFRTYLYNIFINSNELSEKKFLIERAKEILLD